MSGPTRIVAAVLLVGAPLACSSFGADDPDGPDRGVQDASGEDAGGDAPTSGDGAASEGGPPRGDAGPPLAMDTFSRTVASGFGVAEVGGAWRVVGPADTTSVAGGAGRIVANKSAGVYAFVGPSDERDVDIETVVSMHALGTEASNLGTGLYVSVIGRLAASAYYSAKIVVRTGGGVAVGISSDTPALGESTIFPNRPIGVTLAADEALRIRFDVAGTSPTRLRAKAWKATAPEPEAWQAEIVDSEPLLQGAGQAGLNLYLSNSATLSPVNVAVDDFVVRRAYRPDAR